VRSFNFCAGPAMLPTEVLRKAQQELLDYQGTGTSIMEMSHRSSWFDEVISNAKASLRRLMHIPQTHEILFMHGGATSQFYSIPEQFLNGGKAAYIDTGQWSAKAIEAAQRYGEIDVLASTAKSGYTAVPAAQEINGASGYAYLHYTPNETIGGLAFDYVPEVDVPLVADFSSSILSAHIDVSKFDFIYAGAQKNIGPAGVVLVIASKEFLATAKAPLNKVFDYQAQVAGDSRVNTPPTYPIYLSGLVFEWLEQQGGVAALHQHNIKKANLLYGFIDQSNLFSNPITEQNRSLMNVPFLLKDTALEAQFLTLAQEAGLYNLAGHRSVGGMRASIYNAMPIEGVQALVDFMQHFERQYG